MEIVIDPEQVETYFDALCDLVDRTHHVINVFESMQAAGFDGLDVGLLRKCGDQVMNQLARNHDYCEPIRLIYYVPLRRLQAAYERLLQNIKDREHLRF